MPIVIKNCQIENCGTGIKAEGEVDVDINDIVFINNDKDIFLEVNNESDINIDKIKSINCRTESITIKEYQSKIEKIIDEVNNLDINSENKQLIISKLNSMLKNKNKPKVLEKLLKEIYFISKEIGIQVLVSSICNRFGW